VFSTKIYINILQIHNNDLFGSRPTPELTSGSRRSSAERFNSTVIGKAEQSELQFIFAGLL
jgi:hypothetical protein